MNELMVRMEKTLAKALEMAETSVGQSKTLLADNQRLRGLVKQAEARGVPQYPLDTARVNCPWCQFDTTAGKKKHSVDCPAFTEEGTVR